MKHLVATGKLGDPRHFRSQRFLNWPATSWGWRQYKDTAGAGDLFDMTIHRLDFVVDFLGPLKSVTGTVACFASRDTTNDGSACPQSNVDHWSGLIGEFESGATGVWQGTTLTRGYGLSGFEHEWAEINGSEASAVYRLHEPNTLLFGKTGADLAPLPVPDEFLKPADSPRDINEGVSATVFRYDLVWEFVSAVAEKREAVPSFYDGWYAQEIADSVLQAHEERRWIDTPPPGR